MNPKHIEMKAVAYIRKSTSGTDENGVERQEGSYLRQRSSIEDYAKRRGIEIVRWYEEPVSGKSIRKRKVFLQMVKDAQAPGRPFKAIIFGEYDRFMRHVKEAKRFEVALDDAGVELHFTNLKNDGSMGDEIYKSIACQMAAEYSRELARKVVQGMVQKAKKGSWLGGTAPYGYRSEKDSSGNVQLMVVEKEAKIVREIFGLSLKGHGHKWIAVSLNNRRIPAGIVARNRLKSNRNPDGKWSGSTIRMMLRNPVYKGVFRWNKRARVDCFDWQLQGQGTVDIGKLRTQLDSFKNKGSYFIDREKPTAEWITQEKGVPAIVSAKVFDEVQKRFLPYTSRKWRRPNSVKFLMSGALRCSCGNNFFGHRHCKKGPHKQTFYEYYRCNGELNKGSHGDSVRRMIPCRVVDEVALSGMTERLEMLIDRPKVKSMLKARLDGFTSSRPGRLAELEGELKRIEREMDRLTESYVKFERPIPEEKVCELNARKQSLLKEREGLVQAGDSISRVDVDRDVSDIMKNMKRARERIDSSDSTARIGIRNIFLREVAVTWGADMPRIDFNWRKYPKFTGEGMSPTSTKLR